MGHATRLGSGRIERIAGQLRGRKRAFVVVDKPLGKRLKAGLATALASGPMPHTVPALFRPTSQGDDLLEDEDQ
jgi:hypothetical protein